MKKTDTEATPAIPLVKAAFVMPFRIAMANNSVDANRYFRKFRLPSTALDDPDRLVPEKPFWQLINQVAIAEMIPDFGMQVAQAKPWYSIDSLQPLLHNKRSLRTLLETFCELASSQSNVSDFKLRINGGVCRFENHGQLLVSHDIHMELYRVTSMIELVQLATGKNWKPEVVHLMMDRNKVVNKNSILDGCKRVFSQKQTAIAFPSGLLDATIGTAPDDITAGHYGMDETRAVNTIQDKSDLVNALREIISHYITEDDISIEVIAYIAGLSTRSLQRMMKKHDISYNGLLNEARQQYAVGKLNDPATKISDIAYQLGYSDVAHFTRAFKRWTGIAPSEYRKSPRAC